MKATSAAVPSIGSLVLIAFQPPRLRRYRSPGRWSGVDHLRFGRGEQLVDQRAARPDRLAQMALPLPACAGDVLEADRLTGELRADGAADEAVVAEDPDLGEV